MGINSFSTLIFAFFKYLSAVGNNFLNVFELNFLQSKNVEWPCILRSCIALETMSLGARSDKAWIFFINLLLFSSTKVAPSPLIASVRSGFGSTPISSAVGWNCTNSKSTSSAPAVAANDIPSP